MALTSTEFQRETFFCYLNSVALNLEIAVDYYSNFSFWFKGACRANCICSLFLRLEDFFFFPVTSTWSARLLLTFLQYVKRCWRQCRTRHRFSTSLMKALLCLSPCLSLSPFSCEMIKYFLGHDGQCCSQKGVAACMCIPNLASLKCRCTYSGMSLTLLILDLAWRLLYYFTGSAKTFVGFPTWTYVRCDYINM